MIEGSIGVQSLESHGNRVDKVTKACCISGGWDVNITKIACENS